MNSPEAPAILSKEREDGLLRAIHTRDCEAPYFNLRNVLRLATAEAFEMGRSSRDVAAFKEAIKVGFKTVGAAIAQCQVAECSVCARSPAIEVSGTYWLCGPCVLERIEPQQTTTQDPRPIPPWERRELMPYMTLNDGCRKCEEQKYETELAEWEGRNK